jgi:hypothetical protein
MSHNNSYISLFLGSLGIELMINIVSLGENSIAVRCGSADVRV